MSDLELLMRPVPEGTPDDSEWATFRLSAGDVRKVQRWRSIADELAAALEHMQWCASCAQGSWGDCDGGRDALTTLARYAEAACKG